MGIEIERKFLVDNFPFQKYSDSIYYSSANITQGYFKNKEVRIRIISYGLYELDIKSFLTIKSKRTGISRYEFEYEIPDEDADFMIEKLCENTVVKNRYTCKERKDDWEIDIFDGDNKGLILAEIELDSEDQEVRLPEWIGKEVTNDERYYNSYLAKNPYSKWGKPDCLKCEGTNKDDPWLCAMNPDGTCDMFEPKEKENE